MKPITIILLLLLLVVPAAWSDNEVGGSDMPWDDPPSTGISDVRLDSISKSSTIYYDLHGHKVDRPRSGTIYIVNGKKVIKK